MNYLRKPFQLYTDKKLYFYKQVIFDITKDALNWSGYEKATEYRMRELLLNNGHFKELSQQLRNTKPSNTKSSSLESKPGQP